MTKISLFIAFISLYASVPFGSALASNDPSILEPCHYTLTSRGEPITYLNLLKTAARATLGEDFLAFESIVDELITSKSTTFNPNKYPTLSNYLDRVALYKKLQGFSFKQPENGAEYIEASILKTDIDYAIGRILALAYKAKQGFYKNSSSVE